MGLFEKKPPCPICGGKISWFLPAKIEGEYICDECFSKIDMDDDVRNGLTLDGFRNYLAFYEDNLILRRSFSTTDEVRKAGGIVFDVPNRLFCFSKNLDKTVFEGATLKAFRISEDSTVLFEGSEQGLKYFESTVPARVMAMEPQIQMMMQTQRMREQMERLRDDDDRNRSSVPSVNIPEPFRRFYIEMHFDHPYWHRYRFDFGAPTFNNNYPSVSEYLSQYREDVEELERLAELLQQVAFPNAGAGAQTHATTSSSAPQSAPEGASDTQRAIEDIKKFKELLDIGAITQEEFDAKKKQLLGL